MGVCATNCYFLYREGGTKAVVVDPAENGAGIFKLLSEKELYCGSDSSDTRSF